MGKNDPPSTEGPPEDHVEHRVTLTNDYFIGITEVTQGQWQKVMGSTPWKGNRRVKDSANSPAVDVSWEEAVLFCNRLSKREGFSPYYVTTTRADADERRVTLDVEFAQKGTGYRLPTEAEWEYACRAGATTRFTFGDDRKELDLYAWWGPNRDGEFAKDVGLKRPNRWGLYDMHGNVYEWCQDWEDDYEDSPVIDPTGPLEGIQRIYRGGCWYGSSWNCQASDRDADVPTFRHCIVGFRAGEFAASSAIASAVS